MAISNLNNSQRALARNALHHGLVAKSLKKDIIEQYQNTLEKIVDDLTREYTLHEDDGHWNYQKILHMRQDVQIYQKIKNRLDALGVEAATTIDDYVLGGIEDAYERKLWELQVDSDEPVQERKESHSRSFWNQLLKSRSAAVFGLSGLLGRIREHIGATQDKLIATVGRGLRGEWTLPETLNSVELNLLPKRGRGNRVSVLGETEYHHAVTYGRTVGRSDNSELVAESIWLNLLDGHKVCPICQPLHGMPAPPIVDEFGEPPIHGLCQCYIMDRVRRFGGKWADYHPKQDPYENLVKKSHFLHKARIAADRLASRAERKMRQRLKRLRQEERKVVRKITQKKSVRVAAMLKEKPWKPEKDWSGLEDHKVMFRDLQTRTPFRRAEFGPAELNLALYKVPKEHALNAKVILENQTIEDAKRAGNYVRSKDEIHLYSRRTADKTEKFYKVRGTLQHEIGHRVQSKMVRPEQNSRWRKLAKSALKSGTPYGDFFYPWIVAEEKGFDLGEKELFAAAYKEYLNYPRRLAKSFPKLKRFFDEEVFRGIRP